MLFRSVEALTAARSEGLRVLASARLEVVGLRAEGLDGGERAVVWVLRDNSSGKDAVFYVDGFTGAFMRGLPSDSLKERDMGWSVNASTFEGLARARQRRPGPPPAGWIPPFGAYCRTGASCRALQARDNDAAIRLDGGMPSAADLEKYDR